MKGPTFLVGDGGTGIGGTVNEPLDLIFVPDDFKEVEVVSEGAVGELVLGWGEHGVFMFLVGVMDIGFDDSVVIRAVEFKDVNFAAAGAKECLLRFHRSWHRASRRRARYQVRKGV